MTKRKGQRRRLQRERAEMKRGGFEYAPGSLNAEAAGCTCPVLDNARGAGLPRADGGVDYWINEHCPLHTK